MGEWRHELLVCLCDTILDLSLTHVLRNVDNFYFLTRGIYTLQKLQKTKITKRIL